MLVSFVHGRAYEYGHLPRFDYQAYLTILASSALLLHPTSWSRTRASQHLTILLFSTFAIYAYRNLWPLATFTLTPKDSLDKWSTWIQVGLTFLGGLVIPLVTPTVYVPIDLKVSGRFVDSRIHHSCPVTLKKPDEPNGEQTASLLSMALFSWLDSIIWKAWKGPQLTYESLPSLCDYDRAEHLKGQSFDSLQAPWGDKTRSLGHRLLRIFRKR